MEKRRQKHLAALTFILMTAMLPIVGSHTQAGKYYYISIGVAGILFIPFLLIVLRIADLSREYGNVFEYLSKTNGFIGRRFAGIYATYALTTAVTSLRTVGEEIKLTSLFNTPLIVLFLFMSVLYLYVLSKGYRVLGHFSALYAPILVVSIIAYALLSVGRYEFGNFEPINLSDIDNIAISTAESITGFFGDAVLVLFVCGMNNKKEKAEPLRKRYFILAYAFAFLCLLVTVLNSLLVIGGEALNKLYFPHYVTVSLINLGFVARLETVVDILYFIALNVKIAFSLYCAAKGFVYRFNRIKVLESYTKYINIGVCLICAVVAAFGFDSIRKFFAYIEFYRYGGPFMILILLGLWITTEIVARRGRINSIKEGKLPSAG